MIPIAPAAEGGMVSPPTPDPRPLKGFRVPPQPTPPESLCSETGAAAELAAAPG